MSNLIKTLRSENRNLRKEINKLKKLSYYDGLTGLFNKPGFEQRVIASLSLIRRKNGSLCLGIFDLDGFKQINDKLGHKEGDRILIMFAKVLSKYTRLGDILCRWGGDEFVIALPFSRLQDAKDVGERIRKHMEKKYGNKKYPVTVSGAFNEISFENSNSNKIMHRDFAKAYETLFKKADKKLLCVAKLSKNKIV